MKKISHKNIDGVDAMSPYSTMRAKTAVLVFALLMTSLALYGFLSAAHKKPTLVAPNGKIRVELAQTQAERELGLMNRQKLNRESGMLFIFDDGGANCFWMKDTVIPLDMVWLDSNKKVVYVHHDAKPFSEESICPDAPATYVLEINAGQANELGLSVGVQTSF